MVITTVTHARLRREAGVHKYDDGKHHGHFSPLTKVAQYFAGYKRSFELQNFPIISSIMIDSTWIYNS